MSGYVQRELRKFLNQSNVWTAPQTFANGIGQAGTVTPGNVYYVDPTNGTTGASGKSLDTAVDDLAEAYGKCTSGAGDVIYVISQGTTTAGCTTYLTSALTWSKHGITVIGVAAPTQYCRARISTQTDLAKLLSVTGDNNSFYNLHFFQAGDDAADLGCVEVTGNRNYFENCHIAGGGHATPAAETTMYSLKLNGAEEARFVGCTIGTDTIIRAAANADIMIDGGCARCEFIDCRIESYSETAGHGAINTVDAAAITRNLLFKNCVFDVFAMGGVGSCNYLCIGTAPTNGIIMFVDCNKLGWTSWATGNDAYYTMMGGTTAIVST